MPHALDPTELHFVIREEDADDVDAIDAVTRDAFRTHPFSRQTEHLIVHGLRAAGALSLSLVATVDGDVIGHVAFSPVSIDGASGVWWGLGPVSVAPAQRTANCRPSGPCVACSPVAAPMWVTIPSLPCRG